MHNAALSRGHRLKNNGLSSGLHLIGQPARHPLKLLPAAFTVAANVNQNSRLVSDLAAEDSPDEKLQCFEGLPALSNKQTRVISRQLEPHPFLILLGPNLGLDLQGQQGMKGLAAPDQPLPTRSDGEPDARLLPSEAKESPRALPERFDQHILTGDAELP